MKVHRLLLWIAFLPTIYLALCAIAGVIVVEVTLHPARRPLPADAFAQLHEFAFSLDSEMQPATIIARDGIALRAWSIRPKNSNGDAVILLHGMSDNRLGMSGAAQMLVRHGYSLLMPDARAHGESGGTLATYGFFERDDIRRWFEWLEVAQKPACIYGFGESMGAAELLQSLPSEPHFCAVAAESALVSFREIAYDIAWVRRWARDRGLGGRCFDQSLSSASYTRDGVMDSTSNRFLPAAQSLGSACPFC